MIELETARRVATEAVTRAGELALKHWKAAGMQAPCLCKNILFAAQDIR